MQARLILLLGRLLPQPLLRPFPKSHHQDRPSSTLCPCPASAGGAHLSFTQLSQVGLVDKVLLVVRDPRGTLVSRYFISMHFKIINLFQVGRGWIQTGCRSNNCGTRRKLWWCDSPDCREANRHCNDLEAAFQKFKSESISSLCRS